MFYDSSFESVLVVEDILLIVHMSGLHEMLNSFESAFGGDSLLSELLDLLSENSRSNRQFVLELESLKRVRSVRSVCKHVAGS